MKPLLKEYMNLIVIIILLFPVDRNMHTHEIFSHFQSNVFDAASLLQMYHVIGLKQTCGIKNTALKVAKKFVRVAVYWEEE